MDKKIVIPVALVDFIEDAADLTSEELGQAFRLAIKKVQYERRERYISEIPGRVHCEDDNAEIEHENSLVKFAAIILYDRFFHYTSKRL